LAAKNNAIDQLKGMLAQYNFSEAYNKADAKPMSQSEHKRPENEQESQLRIKINQMNVQVIQGVW